MYMLTVVITATNAPQRVVALPPVGDNANTCFQSIIPQYNGKGILYLGDQNVSPTNSLVFTPGGSLGSAQAFSSNPGDLKDFYVYGASGDYLNIMVIP